MRRRAAPGRRPLGPAGLLWGVGVCGEAGGDPLLALVLVGLGVTTLSMATGRIPMVRWALSRHTQDECRALTGAALGAGSASDAREAVRAAANPELTELL